MARHRWTLVLILVCLPILATVISAFRVNLPKSSQEKLDTKKQQPSDVHDYKFGKLNSVKIESAKRSYDDLKKIVREKITETKPSNKFIDISSDDNDDDDFNRISQIKLKHQEPIKLIQKPDNKYKSGQEQNIKKPYLIHRDDADGEKNAEKYKSKNIPQKAFKKKISEKGNNLKKQIWDSSQLLKNDDIDEDNDNDEDSNGHYKDSGDIEDDSDDHDEDDDEDDDSEGDDINDDDDDDEDDDDDDSDNEDDADDDDDDSNGGFFKMLLQTFTIKVEDTDKSTNEGVKDTPLVKSSIKEKDDPEDDDEDEYEEDANDVKSEIRKHKNLKTQEETLKPLEIRSITKEAEEYKKETKSEQKNYIPEKAKLKSKPKVDLKVEIEKDKKDDKKEPVKVSLNDKKDKNSKGTNKVEIINKKEENAANDSKSKEETKAIVENKKVDEKLTPKVKTIGEKTSISEVKKKEEKSMNAAKNNNEKVSDHDTTHKEVKRKIQNKVEEKHKGSSPMDKPKISDNKKDLKKESIEKDSAIDKKVKTSTDRVVDSQESDAKHENHLEHVTLALRRRYLLQSEFEDFYTFFPTFAPNFSRIHNPECRRHGQILLRQLRGSKLWALNMVDATAKIPSGILQGNSIQLGNFDQCLASHAKVQLETGSVVSAQGKYCLARLDLKAEYPELELPVHLAQAKNLIKSRIDDPGHFVPRFSTLSWGVCMPAVCEARDVEVAIKDAVLHYQHVSGLTIKVKVDSNDCYTQEPGDWWEHWLELPTLLTLSFYAVVILLVLVATIQDIVGGKKSEENADDEKKDDKKDWNQKNTKEDEKNVAAANKSDGVLRSFSLYRTINKLLSPGTDDEIPCIHGVRGIATIALLISHKFLPVAVTPFTNRLKITETVSSPIWSWCRAGWMYTDCFLLLSGTLTAHRMLSDSDTPAPKRLLSRYLRLTPALLAVVLFYAYIWDNISTGPMWGTLVTKNSEICREGWWWNLLYIQNYFGFEDMCAPQTHQLALDMQLTIIGCLVTWATQVSPGLSKLLLPGIHIWAAYSRYTTVRDHRLTMLVYHGVSVSQLYRTARLSYTSTLHRCSAYVMGLSLGLALQKSSRIHKLLHILGWIFSCTLWGLVWWAGFDSGSTQYRYSVNFAAPYAALAPIASAIAIAWVIYAVHCGNCDFLSRILCCRPLVLISRLSYALYLSQFIVFFTNAATIRSSSQFTLMSMIDLQEISAIIILSVILTLTLVIPLQSLPKMISISIGADSKEMAETSNMQGLQKKQNEALTNEVTDMPQIRNRQYLVAHREVLEEIPEAEFEYEMQRDKLEGLEEIIEEEEDEPDEEEMHNNYENEELEIIEEEQGGEEEYWGDREEYEPRRPYSQADRDLDEWEWTANSSGQDGAQCYGFIR